VAFKPPQVRSLGLDPNERLTAQDGTLLEVVARPVKGKDSVHLHPDDLARLGSEIVLKPPFPPPGADAFRWLFYASNPPWNNTRISLKAILEGQREFLFRLKNVHQFFVLNAGEAFVPGTPAGEHVLDRWILHELDVLVEKVTAWLDAFRPFEPARAIQDFVDGLSNWWLRRSRDRFDDDGADGQAARDTLYFVLTTLSRLIAPFVPFMADAIHLSLAGEGDAESVHLCDWPVTDASRRAPELAADMLLLRELASLGLAARVNVGVRVRQPLAAAEVVLADAARAERLAALVTLLSDELNVREVRFSQEAERFVAFKVKPDYKALGARLGKDMKAVAAEIGKLTGAEVRARLAAGDLVLAGHALGAGDVLTEVSPLEGFQAAGSASAVVALHAALDEDLLEEGLSRELASRVQGARKALSLRYGEVARLHVDGDARLGRALARYGEVVCAQASVTLADLATVGDPEVTSFELDGVNVRFVLVRIAG
jgi:isoleucyl-tRNA synthetase